MGYRAASREKSLRVLKEIHWCLSCVVLRKNINLFFVVVVG